MVVVIDDNGVLAGVAECQGHAAIAADWRRHFKGHGVGFLIEVVQIRPIAGVLGAQWGGEGHGEAKGAVVGQFKLHTVTLAGNGIDHLHRDAVAVHGHAHVNVGEVGVLRNVAALHRPGHTVAQINHQGHILASESFKHFLVQLGAAAGKIHRHRLARLSVLNGVGRFFAHRWRCGWG